MQIKGGKRLTVKNRRVREDNKAKTMRAIVGQREEEREGRVKK